MTEVLSTIQSSGYEAPGTISGVIETLRKFGDNAKILAGGQSLLVLLRQGYVAPDVLVSLKGVAELTTTSYSPSGGLSIGSMVRQAELETSATIRTHYAALADAASVVASVQVRNQGTLGGNLCHADPTADPPAALIALGATITVTGWDGERSVPIQAFFRDYMEVDLEVGEIVTRIVLPAPARGSGSAYLKHRVRQVDTAIVGSAAWVRLDETGVRIDDIGIGLSGAAMTPLKASGAEAVARGENVSAETIDRTVHAAMGECSPLDDTEASEWYRREMVGVMVRRALTAAISRAGHQLQDIPQ